MSINPGVGAQVYGMSWNQRVEFKGIKKVWCDNGHYYPLTLILFSALLVLVWPFLLASCRAGRSFSG